MPRFLGQLLACTAALVVAASEAPATIIAVADPSVASEFGARVRWGNGDFEASIFDSEPGVDHDPTLNPAGSPVWTLNDPYAFEVAFSAATGMVSLAIDFNRDGDFLDVDESAARSVFLAPGQTSYVGYGFEYLSISGRENNSTTRSTLSNLVINGDPQASITPDGAFVRTYYAPSGGGPMSDVQVTGDLTFLTPGTSAPRPVWNVRFRGPIAVPEPSSLTLIGIGAAALAVGRSRRRRREVAD